MGWVERQKLNLYQRQQISILSMPLLRRYVVKPNNSIEFTLMLLSVEFHYNNCPWKLNFLSFYQFKFRKKGKYLCNVLLSEIPTIFFGCLADFFYTLFSFPINNVMHFRCN